MKKFSDLKVGDKIYKYDWEKRILTYDIITDIHFDKYNYYFCFNGKLNLSDEDFYVCGDYIRLEDWEADRYFIDSGWAISEVKCFVDYLKEALEYEKREYEKKLDTYTKAIDICSVKI